MRVGVSPRENEYPTINVQDQELKQALDGGARTAPAPGVGAVEVCTLGSREPVKGIHTCGRSASACAEAAGAKKKTASVAAVESPRLSQQ